MRAGGANDTLAHAGVRCMFEKSLRFRSMDSIIALGRLRSLPIAAATVLRRHWRPAGADRVWDRLSGAVLIGAAILVVLTFTDYGVTWDEDVHNWYGVFALDYYLSLFADQRALHWLNLYNYGAAFDMVAAALNKFAPRGVYETRHLLNGLVGLFGLAGCWKLGRVLGGPRAGFIALLFLVLAP